MLSVLRQRNFALLWWGGLISFMGDWALFIALPLYVYTLTGSVAAMGGLFIVGVLPGILLGTFAGVLVDRWDRKSVLIFTNLALAPLISLLLVFDSPGEVWLVYMVSLLSNTIRQLLNPAEGALLPKLVGQSDLVTANSLNSLNNNLARLVGPAVGGMAFAWFGFQAAVAFDVATFLVAAGLIALIRAPKSVTRANHTEGEEGVESQPRPALTPRAMVAEWLEGLRMIKHNRMLSSLLTLLGISCVADGVITVLLVVYVTQALGGGSQELGWLMTAQAVGGLVGAALIGRLGKKLKAWQLVGYGFLLLGLLDLAIFAIPVLPLNLGLFVMAGLPIVGLEVGAMTLFQSVTHDRYRGRVFGAYGTTASLLALAGRGLATVVGGTMDLILVLCAMAVLNLAAGVLAIYLLHDPKQKPLSQMTDEHLSNAEYQPVVTD